MSRDYVFDNFGSAAARRDKTLPPPENYEMVKPGMYKLKVIECEHREIYQSKCCGTEKFRCGITGIQVYRKQCFDCNSDPDNYYKK